MNYLLEIEKELYGSSPDSKSPWPMEEEKKAPNNSIHTSRGSFSAAVKENPHYQFTKNEHLKEFALMVHDGQQKQNNSLMIENMRLRKLLKVMQSDIIDLVTVLENARHFNEGSIVNRCKIIREELFDMPLDTDIILHNRNNDMELVERMERYFKNSLKMLKVLVNEMHEPTI